MHVLDGAQLHVEKIAHLAVAVCVVADAVKLQVCVTHARFESLLAEFLALRELDTVGCGLHAVVSHFARVPNCVEEVRMHRRLAAGELHGHLTARLDLGGVLENFLNFFPAQLVNVSHLVSVHEAGIAHHVAAVREVNGEDRAAAVANSARTMAVQVFVIVRRNIAAREIPFNPFEEFRVNGHQVFKLAMDGALFHHPDLAIALDNLRFDFADLLVNEVGPIFIAVQNQVARFAHTVGTERVRGARPSERGLGFFPRLQQRLFRPLRRERRVGIVLVKILNRVEGNSRRLAKRPIERFPKLSRNCARHNASTSP